MKIFKYTLEVTDIQKINMPQGAKVLSVQQQHGEIQLWALVQENNPTELRSFRIHGTGNSISSCEFSTFIGTVQMPPFVWHVFEIASHDQAPSACPSR